MRDAAGVVLLLLLSLAWSGGNLALALSGGAGSLSEHLVATSAPTDPVGADAALTDGQLAGAVAQAKSDWLAVRPSADLSSVAVSIADLPGLTLGDQAGDSVTIDVDAAGWGWQAMDLTTVVRHEIGHVLGLGHSSGLMGAELAPGASFGVSSDYAEPAPVVEQPAEAAPDPASTDSTTSSTDTSTTSSSTDSSTGATGSTDSSTDSGSTGSSTGTTDSAGSSTGTTGSTDSGATADTSSTGGSTSGSTTDPGTTEPMTMPEPVGGTTDSGLSTEGVALPTLSTGSLAAPLTTAGLGVLSTPTGTAGDDVITVVETGPGTYSIRVRGAEVGTVSGSDTFTLDGLDGTDLLVGPDVASVWKITGINAGTLELAGGAKVAFTHVESLTGATTAADEFRFDDQAGLTGAVDDGAGQLTVTVAGFVRVVGDYGFERDDAYDATVSGSSSTVTANLLTLGGTTGNGFVGVEVLGSSIGISGVLSSFTLAVITASDQAWHAFTGTVTTPTIGGVAGLDLDMHLKTLSVSVNSSSKNDSWLDLSANPVTSTHSAVALAFNSKLVSATVPVLLDLGGFLFVNGNVTLTKGGPTSVDISTGLGSTDPSLIPAGLKDATKVPVVTEDPTDGSIGRSDDYATLWNLKVSSLQFAFTGANAFIGNGFGWNSTTDADGVLSKAEVGSDAVGIFAGGINLIMVLLTPLGGMPLSQRFLSVKGTVGSIGLVGLDDVLTLDVDQLEFDVNRGPTLVTGAGMAVVDWVASFPDADTSDDPADPYATDPTPAGWHPFIGGPSPPVIIFDSTSSAFGVSATRAVLTIAGFVHIGARFSLQQGKTEYVDVNLDHLSAPAKTQLESALSAVSATDPGGITTGRNSDTSKIWNLPVKTLLVGLSDASVFVGYNPGGLDPDTDLPLTAADLDADAVGLLASGLTLGLVVATPIRTAFTGANLLPTFTALRADLASLTPIGLPSEFVLSFTGIRLELNRGGAVTGSPTSNATVDWAASFPGGTPGLLIPAGRSDDSSGTSVRINFSAPLLRISATRVVLAISDFIYLSGGFALELGTEIDADIDTAGIPAATSGTLAGLINGGGAAQADDPADGSVGATEDASTIWNLPVRTTMFGISHGSVFIGYNPNLQGTDGTSFNTGSDTILDEADLGDGAIGFLANNIDIAMVFASVIPDPGRAWANQLPRRFWALKASIGVLVPVGLPSEFVLRFEGVELTVNRGGPITGAPKSAAWINWTKTFPGDAGADTVVPPGLRVATAPDEAIYLDFEDPIIGISATRVVLAISDFIYLSGGFAFEQGARHDVDLDTGSLGSGLTSPGGQLANAINGLGGAQATDPEDGSTGATANATTIWNVPISTTTFGIADGSIFVGYNPNLQGTSGTSFNTGSDTILDEADLGPGAIGFLANHINVGLVFASVEKDPTKAWMNQLPDSFWALKASVGLLKPIGLPSEFKLEFVGVMLTINKGGAVTGAPGGEVWVNWESSFPEDTEADPAVPAGLAVPTGTGNAPVYVDFKDPILGISATRVTIAISDFVFISGGFAFEKGGRVDADIRTSGLGLGGSTFAAQVNGGPVGSATDPTNGSTKATTNGSTIWNVPVVTTLIGVSGASIFVGYNPNEPGTEGTSFNTGDDSILDEDELSDDAIGLLANNINIGIVLAKVEPIAGASWDDQLPSFYAVQANIGLLTPVGLPSELVFRFEDVALTLNKGGPVNGTGNAWIDWAHSLPDPDGSGPLQAGIAVPTGQDNPPIWIAFEDPIFGISAGRVVISIYNFVHISGGFAFEKGGQETVDINTGLVLLGPDAGACALLGTAATSAAAQGEDVALSGDCTKLTGVTVETIKVGVYNASLFVGYNPNPVCPEGSANCPVFDTGADGILQKAELSPGAIGFLGGGINLGFVFATLVRGPFAQGLGEGNAPSFYTIKAHVDELGLVGVPGIDLFAKGAEVNVNSSTKKWSGGTGATSPPAINWATSLPGDADTPVGLEIPTGGDNPSVYLDAEGFIIGGGANQFTLQISEFIYLSGSFYFEYGAVKTMPLTDGIVSTDLLQTVIDNSGIPGLGDFLGESEKELQFFTIGAQNVHAFVGLNGPYWVDANDNGVIDDDETDTNPDAVGLVLEDVDFALAMMTPTNRIDPIRYIALKASAAYVALVGIDGLTVEAKNIEVELNISTPLLYGLPVLPVVDFGAYDDANGADDPFSVKVGAPAEFGGAPIVVPFTYDTPLIRAAAADINLDVFGVLALRGSIAFELGRTADVTLADGTKVLGVTTMTIGGANLLGFVGIDGPSWQTDSDGDVIWVQDDGVTPCTPSATVDCKAKRNPDAIGIAIEDLDFGIFVGVKADPTNPAVYVAADVHVDAFGLVGLPDGFTLGGTLAIALNLGLVVGASSSLSAIDFKKSFHYDPDGEQGDPVDGCTPTNPDWAGQDPDCDDVAGLAVPTGNPANPHIIDFEKTFVSVQVAGVLTLGQYMVANGVFFLDISDQGLNLLVLADLRIGPDITAGDPLFDIGAIGVVIINGDGIAADLDVEMTIGNSSIGLELSAEARLLLNTAGVDMSLEIPDTLWGFFQDLQAGKSPTGGTVSAALLDGPGSMTGEFLGRLKDCGAPDSNPDDDRCYVISGNGPRLIAGSNVDEGTINGLLGNGGTITLSSTPGAYLAVVLTGRLTIAGFADAYGLVAVSLRSGAFEMVVSLRFQLGASQNTSINVNAEGILGLYSDGVFLSVNVSVKANLLSIFDLDVNGLLVIDTTHGNDTATDTKDAYFHLNLNGSVKVLRLISLSGSLDIAVSDKKWAVQASLGASFGPLSMHAEGFILSTGTFSFDLGGNIDLTIAGTGIKGYLNAHASFCHHAGDLTSDNNTCTDEKDPTSADFGANGNTRTFRITLTGGVDVKLFGITLAGADIAFYGEGTLGGRITVKAKFTVKILFVKKSVTITIADFYLPVSLVNSDSPPPKLATLGSGGVLHLNVGADGDERGVNQTETVEEYVVRRDGSDIVVSAFGYEERFSGVTRIEGDFGSGNDSFTAFNELNVPVLLHGGIGNDFLAFSSTTASCPASGFQATLYGDAGNDDLRGGSCSDYLDGGTGNDYLDGGAGVDTLIGGDNDDTFYGYITDVMGETISAGAGTDSLELVGTPGADTISVGTNGTAVRIGYSGQNLDLTAFENLTLRTQGGDSLTMSGNLSTVGIQNVNIGFGMTYQAPNEATVCTDAMRAADPNQTACTDQVTVLGGSDTVTVNLLDTGDILTVSGSMATPLAVLSRGSGGLVLEDDPTDTPTPVATTVMSWAGGYTIKLSGSSLATGERDQLDVNMLGGDDLLKLTSLQIASLFDLGGGNDVVKVGSNASGAHTNGTLNGVAAPLDIAGGSGSDTVDADDSGDTAANTGTLTNNELKGLGLHGEGLGYTSVELLDIRLGSGGDTFTVTSTSSSTTTTLRAGAGNDTITIVSVSGPTFVYGDAGADIVRIQSVSAPLVVEGGTENDTFLVGSIAPTLGGVLDQIAAYVKLDGGAGTDSLQVDDTGDSTGDIGYLTAGRIAGLGMTVDAGHTAAKPAWAVTVLGGADGAFTLTVRGVTTAAIAFDASPKVVEDAINAILGAGTVSVSRSPLTRGLGTTYLIRWIGAFTGAPPAISVNADSTLTSTGGSVSIQQMSSGYIEHLGFETLTLGLGGGHDLFDVDSTPTGSTTTLNAGGGDDVLTVETISGPTAVYGQAGNDSISVNALPGLPNATNGIGGRLTLTGGGGSDDYTIQLFSNGSSRIDVVDGVGASDGGSNTLTINGSTGADTFLLRSGLVAALNTPDPLAHGEQQSFLYAEMVTYGADMNAGLVVNGLEGNDLFAVDDNSTVTTLNGGAGDDKFNVGQLYGEGDGHISFDSAFTPTLTDTTRGMLSNGVSYSTTINGGSGGDTFQILRNVAVLQLNGESGDDAFIVRTFLKEGDDTSDASTGINSGGGTNVVQYVVNAPVSIDGGTGFDTLVLVGTEADDVFVISKDGIWGAGRFISFVGIERVDVDGAEGDDIFVVVSTSPDVLTRVFGGLGSDTILVGSAAPIVVADDLRGHSGIIEHSVESNLGNWAGIAVDGVVAEIGDNDEPSVILSPLGGLLVRESGGTATYTVTLNKVPTSTVLVTVVAPNLTPDDLASRSRNVEVSYDGIHWAKSATLSFDATHLTRTVYVRAIDDLAAEGERFVVLQHLVQQPGGAYNGLPVLNAVVRLVDNDEAGVTVVADKPEKVTEGDSTPASYTLELDKAPAGTVKVAVNPGGDLQVSLNGTDWSDSLTVTFTTANWSTPVTVYVRAVDDTRVEGYEFSEITHTVTTGDGAAYPTSTQIEPVSVLVADNDTPTVRIIESGGDTVLAEGSSGPFATDSYGIVLTSDPGAGNTVTVHIDAKDTKTLDGAVEHDDKQVMVSVDNGATWHYSTSVTFDSTNWDDVRTVLVKAVDDTYIDGSDYQAFASTGGSFGRTHQIQGPLYVFGGDDPEGDRSFPDPVMLPGEFTDAPVTTPNPAFDVVEADQVDTLVVDNHNSVAAESGTLTATQLSGLGMGGPRTIGGRTFNAGITYTGLEALQVQLGSGVDTFTVGSTHHGRTEITTGAGADQVTVRSTAGHTRIDGGLGNDSFTVGGAGLVDLVNALLLIDGGDGTDTVHVDDSAETQDQLATLTRDSLTGLDMVARDGIDRMYSVNVWSSATFTITLAGYGTTAALSAGASAATVQAALQNLLFPDATSCGKPAGDPDASTPDQDSRCAQSVYVWKQGSTFFIGFTGEVAGAGAPALTSSQTDLARLDGISYFGLENLHVDLGSGNDGVNVRGTSASTSIDTGAGDDLVFVSDAANLGNRADVLDAVDLSGLADWLAAHADRDVETLFTALLHGTVTNDDRTYTGSLDQIQGALAIDTGAGSNTLAVSDRGDADKDPSFVITNSSISGLSAGVIGYTSTGGDLAGQGVWTTSADSGLFGRGISVFLGSGGNTGRIDSVRGGALSTSPFGATTTTLYAGEGNDSVTINANLPGSGAAKLVVHGQGGDDTIMAATTATQPLVLFGGAGNDTLGGGAGDDLVFGDTGRVYYLVPVGVVGAYQVVLGGAPVPAHLLNPRTGTAVPGDAAFTTVDVLRTAGTSVGGDDTLSGRAGNDILLGGRSATAVGDTIHGDAGNDLVFGDFGWVGALSATSYVNTAQLPLSMAVHPFAFVSVDSRDANGGNDSLYGDAGGDILLGQQGADTIRGGDGDDDIIGGHNVAGGLDTGDFIGGGTGNDVVVGDNGEVLRTGSTLSTLVRVLVGGRLYLLDPTTQTYYTGSSVTAASQLDPTGTEVRAITILDHARDTAAGLFGADVVDSGAGNDLVFGQLGNDILNGGDGADYVEGNGGNDTIYGGLGQDDLIGGSSELFGLTTPARRPDGSDTIYGGTGNDITRNTSADTSASNDADVIVGDNGNIYKIIGSGGQFLSFTHTALVIPRVVKHLDYSPTGEAGTYWQTTTDKAHPVLVQGTGTNIGAADFLHGEGGNDVIHGLSGDDALWGEAGDDDLYGQAGNDWLSGGTGTDGLIGDDGLLLTSRNGSTEPLNYVDTATVQQVITSNGPHHVVTVNVTGALTKAADLEPFYVGYNDVMYGGLGNDFVHGGEGDDAISGGEALAVYYTSDPLATLALYYVDDNPLQFGYSDPEEFRYYDENDPMRLVKACPRSTSTAGGCQSFLTTADATGNDGNDALFGDGGSDWMSGGTGVDHLFGGWGNDLLDVDDDKTTSNGSNGKPDSDSNADYAFGGAGRDVLIANTKSDRLIDWIGEFNSYLVPFNPFGASTVWRASSPAVRQFLYDLSKADGADQTRAPLGTRNGEPYGEIAATSSADAEWGDQHGAPGDPQPGNGGTFDDTLATAGTTVYNSTGTSMNTTFSSTTTSPVESATVARGTKSANLTVNLSAKRAETYRILVQTADLDDQLTTLGTISIAPRSTTGKLSFSYTYFSGMTYEMLWVPSTDPTNYDLVLVLRQIA
ncbi:hypothetical protein [Nocardioides marmoribigeumensis]|uniref:Ca2+-binding RTX toxin-like protein n=1 Tax=Nocardioides marmoribigeumensis TaxID=433649 RepID=A0ABU2BWJ1_9ACTN|nr:hypothetical protein [Nocardioides marmoribigeumensis]MDR7361819.1 Ca2+-binding RTX toxin-like protein [Nocardioides marmoribigeumensis]